VIPISIYAAALVQGSLIMLASYITIPTEVIVELENPGAVDKKHDSRSVLLPIGFQRKHVCLYPMLLPIFTNTAP